MIPWNVHIPSVQRIEFLATMVTVVSETVFEVNRFHMAPSLSSGSKTFSTNWALETSFSNQNKIQEIFRGFHNRVWKRNFEI